MHPGLVCLTCIFPVFYAIYLSISVYIYICTDILIHIVLPRPLVAGAATNTLPDCRDVLGWCAHRARGRLTPVHSGGAKQNEAERRVLLPGPQPPTRKLPWELLEEARLRLRKGAVPVQSSLRLEGHQGTQCAQGQPTLFENNRNLRFNYLGILPWTRWRLCPTLFGLVSFGRYPFQSG